VTITQTGSSHLSGKIIVNVKLNYLPLDLIQSQADCSNSCGGLLDVSIVKGFNSSTSIKSYYIPTTSFSFSIEIDFRREPIGLFTLQIGIDSGLALKYFSGIDTSAQLLVNVNPAFMSIYQGGAQGKAEDTLQ
jgi:hypothetical protein